MLPLEGFDGDMTTLTPHSLELALPLYVTVIGFVLTRESATISIGIVSLKSGPCRIADSLRSTIVSAVPKTGGFSGSPLNSTLPLNGSEPSSKKLDGMPMLNDELGDDVSKISKPGATMIGFSQDARHNLNFAEEMLMHPLCTFTAFLLQSVKLVIALRTQSALLLPFRFLQLSSALFLSLMQLLLLFRNISLQSSTEPLKSFRQFFLHSLLSAAYAKTEERITKKIIKKYFEFLIFIRPMCGIL